jgi:hypothetical protein
MINRQLIFTKIENSEAQLKTLERIVKQGEPIQTYTETIEKIRGYLDEIRSMVSREPMSAAEGNGLH